MLGDISSAVSIFVITGYTDMRKSIDGLCAIILDQLKAEPDGRSIYLFCGKRCGRIMVLLREPDGYVLLYKRLHVVQGRYRWPRNKSWRGCARSFLILPANDVSMMFQDR